MINQITTPFIGKNQATHRGIFRANLDLLGGDFASKGMTFLLC